MLTLESPVTGGDIPLSRYMPAGTEETTRFALTGEQMIETRAVYANK
jgi:hypothetical protein